VVDQRKKKGTLRKKSRKQTRPEGTSQKITHAGKKILGNLTRDWGKQKWAGTNAAWFKNYRGGVWEPRPVTQGTRPFSIGRKTEGRKSGCKGNMLGGGKGFAQGGPGKRLSITWPLSTCE